MSEYVLHGINFKTFNPYYKTLWRVRHEVDNWMGHKFTNYYKLLVTTAHPHWFGRPRTPHPSLDTKNCSKWTSYITII